MTATRPGILAALKALFDRRTFLMLTMLTLENDLDEIEMLEFDI